MGPKKKKKGNKLARMSEEERIRYLQHRAAIEEEARRRKEQLVATYLKNKLKREEAFSRLNNAKINQQWRHVLRQIKNKDLKDDMLTLWRTFETAVNCKNKLIENLLHDLKAAEAQYLLSFKTHSAIIDKLIDIHKSRLSDIHQNYEEQKTIILKEAYTEQRNTLSTANGDIQLLKTVKYFTEVDSAKKLERFQNIANEREDELRNSMQCRIERMESDQIKVLESLAKECQRVVKNYASSIVPITVHYNVLKVKDGTSSLERMENVRCIQKSTDTINRLKKQIENLKESHETQLKMKREEKNKLTTQFQKLRKQLKGLNEAHQDRIRGLSIISSSVMTDLKKVLEKGSHMQQISENCQKLTTGKEKLLPILTKIQATSETSLQAEEAYSKAVPQPYDKLANFWHKFNKAKIECDVLRINRASLNQENKQLKTILYNYMATISRVDTIAKTN